MGNSSVCRSACGLTGANDLEHKATLQSQEHVVSKWDKETTGIDSLPAEETCFHPFVKDKLKSLVYVETLVPRDRNQGFAAMTNLDITSKSKSKTIAMLQTPGLAAAMSPARAGMDEVAAFKDRLRLAGIDASQWGSGGTKSVDQLFWEIYKQRGCVLTGSKGSHQMKRVTRLVKINLLAEIFGIDHTLVSRMQFMHDGQTVERKQVPLRKLAWINLGEKDSFEWKEEFYDEECPHVECWRTGYKILLEEKLGLSQTWQQLHLIQEENGYKYTTEDNVKSPGYPGLNTLYCIHEVTLRVRDPEHVGVQILGLPEGAEFATAEGDFNFTGPYENDLAIGTQLNIWTWGRAVAKKPATASATAPTSAPAAPAAVGDGKSTVAEAQLIKRVPLPESSAQLLGRMKAGMRAEEPKPPTAVLWSVMEGLKTDWARVKKIAKNIQDPKYSLKHFTADLAAFPELGLYLLEEQSASTSCADLGMSSGRSIGDEYQRTVGAFFAIYWLLRLDIDGKDGFACGVDEKWSPVKVESKTDLHVTQAEKRFCFQQNAMWDFFRKLLFDAGVLETRSSSFFGGQQKACVNEKRLVSLLALTAIHDIMKMSAILPEVQSSHAPYHGYQAGDTIGDHDHALGYIMQHYPSMLPSFMGLDSTERRGVQFTQCNLSFNHGWFVQAEAPPGAIFTKMREALAQEGGQCQIKQHDIAFYFLHWFTDLAGAEPTPLAGCEKFVTKFPLPVLNSFLRSFEFVERIATQSETAIMEEYLKTRWVEAVPAMGPLPAGDSAIAKMRLLCAAQMNAPKVLRDFENLSDDDKAMLSLEMSRTGCAGQHFSPGLVPKEASANLAGPAFLIYYGPAFLQSLGNDEAVKRLSVLAEVYRCARELWPTHPAKAGLSVSIRIDMIKNLSIASIQDACANDELWIMVKHNETEAFIECSSKRKLNQMIAKSQLFQVFDLANLSIYN